MKHFVNCKNSTCILKIYINFDVFYPRTRSEIKEKYPSGFTLRCGNNHDHHYSSYDVFAEPQLLAARTSGTVLGAIMYFVHPVLGAIGIIGGPIIAGNTEEKNSEVFNRSI